MLTPHPLLHNSAAAGEHVQEPVFKYSLLQVCLGFVVLQNNEALSDYSSKGNRTKKKNILAVGL